MFQDRSAAGRLLAEKCAAMVLSDPIVLALPRGGVPVAREIAVRLGAPLDLLFVRKIGAPQEPEIALAAVVDGANSTVAFNKDIMKRFNVTPDDVMRLARAELEEITRRRALYLQNRAPAQVEGRDVILVDDGLATGASMQAAVRALQGARARRVIVAAPVASQEALQELERVIDEVVVLVRPKRFHAVGAYYRDFHQLADREVVEALATHARALKTTASRPDAHR